TDRAVIVVRRLDGAFVLPDQTAGRDAAGGEDNIAARVRARDDRASHARNEVGAGQSADAVAAGDGPAGGRARDRRAGPIAEVLPHQPADETDIAARDGPP